MLVFVGQLLPSTLRWVPPVADFNSAKRGWSATQFSPYATGGSFCQYEMMQRKWLKPCKWVLIREYSVRAIQWIQHDRVWMFVFLKSRCALNESSPSFGRVKPYFPQTYWKGNVRYNAAYHFYSNITWSYTLLHFVKKHFLSRKRVQWSSICPIHANVCGMLYEYSANVDNKTNIYPHIHQYIRTSIQSLRSPIHKRMHTWMRT